MSTLMIATMMICAPGTQIVSMTRNTLIEHASGKPIAVQRGQVAVRAGEATAIVTPDAKIGLGAGSTAEVVVRAARLTRAGAVAGAMWIERKGVRTKIPVGSAWTPGGVVDNGASRAAWVNDQFAAKQSSVAKPLDVDQRQDSSWAIIRVDPESMVEAEVRRMLGDALEALHKARDAEAALAILDDLGERLDDRPVPAPVLAARSEALVLLGRRAEALEMLDRAVLGTDPLDRELIVRRGELRARANRCRAAAEDFASVLRGEPIEPAFERAIYGQARCRALLGDSGGATRDLRRYASEYPKGRFADDVRQRLAR